MCSKKLKDCDICGEPIYPELSGWTEGHNAEPVTEGRCCEICNHTKVIPARILFVQNRQKALDFLANLTTKLKGNRKKENPPYYA
tara:strand:- start:28 stop:282 length:255 start_codon:yes stop_codon:yes gene_type:complete